MMGLATVERVEHGNRTTAASRRVLAAASVVGVALLLGPGCSGDTSSGSSGPAVEDVPGLYADALCQSFEACLGSLTELFLQGNDCKTLLEHQIQDDGFSMVPSAVDDGRIVYRANLIDGCMSKVAAYTCADFANRAPDDCNSALEGQVKIGAQCAIDAECEPGSFCDAQSQCPGLCTARRFAGDACSKDDDCQSGLVCSGDTRLCVVPAAEGEPCEGGAAPPCAFGLLCLNADTGPGSCVDINKIQSATAGETCAFTNTATPVLCTPGVSCAAIAIAGATVTWQCANPVGAGAACHPAFPSMCPDGQYCSAPAASVDGTCTVLPVAGSPCVTAAIPGALCAPGLVCDDGTCREKQSLGSACGQDSTCYSGKCLQGGCVRSDFCQ